MTDEIKKKVVNMDNDVIEDEGGKDEFLGYCHKHSPIPVPQQIEEIVMGIKKTRDIIVSQWFMCIGDQCNHWCSECEVCQDTCEHDLNCHGDVVVEKQDGKDL